MTTSTAATTSSLFNSCLAVKLLLLCVPFSGVKITNEVFYLFIFNDRQICQKDASILLASCIQYSSLTGLSQSSLTSSFARVRVS